MKRLHKGPPDARKQAVAAVAAAAAATRTGAASEPPVPGDAAPSVARTSLYRPPNSQRAKQRSAPSNTPDRFEREVLGGRLWHKACQTAAGGDITDAIPLSFASLDEYVATFDPLVLEEAREGLKSDWAEACGGQAWPVEVAGVEEVADGWAYLRLRAQQGHGELRRACPANSVVVLTEGRPPPRGALEWVQAQVAGGGAGGGRAAKRQRREGSSAPASAAPSASVDSCGWEAGRAELEETADSSARPAAAAEAAALSAGRVVAGIVRRGKEEELLLSIHPVCSAHTHTPDACCWAALELLRRSAAAGGGARRRWWLVPGRMLISNQREYDAVHRVKAIERSLLRFLLKPQLLAPIGQYYDNPEVRRGLWPEQAAQPAFIHYLRSRYDETQLEAIEMAACHLGAPADVADEGAAKHPLLPFVLIQGPPGTGKTHTVKGMLNVWHLVAYQRYYDGLVAATAPSAAPPGRKQSAAPAALNASGSNIVDVVTSSMLSTLGQKVTQTKPRILVCTPSNAACDELLTRVMTDGFADGNGRTYRPNVVRVGSEKGESVNPAVRDRLVGLMVDRYRNMSQGDWQHRFNDLQQRHAHVSRELEALEVSLVRVSRAAAGAPPAPALAGAPPELTPAQQQMVELSKRLADRAQQQQRFAQELERLQLARDLVWGRREEWRLREAEQSIEASFLFEAEMVFTTLSSTQRKVFAQSAAKAPFHTVLIDEAGQASEVAALQPLVFGAKRVVLVGDPQQLPATILSELAKQVQMERSLFERLQQQGAPVKMLSVQYRMHPAIRQFPSTHFYGGRLRDADSIRDMPPAPFYGHPLMKPYVLFDVARGQERRREGGGSLSNREEALLAACLFAELRRFLIDLVKTQPGAVTGPTTVGVITPYREQRKLLRQTFEEVCGKGPASEVFIETVDSFQGKQLDVVILSCVRASTSGGLGFVNDIRRLNVAITRAKRALWVLGSRATLRANPEWAALISDAEQRGVVIEDASARELLPDLPYWQQGRDGAPQDGLQQAAPGGPPGQHQQQQEPPQQQQQQQPAVQAAGMPAAAPMPQQGLPAPLPTLPGSSAGQAPMQGAASSGLHPLQRRQLEQQQQQQQQQQLTSMPLQPHPQPPQQQAPPGLVPPPMQAPQQPRPPGAYPSLPTRR